MKKRKKYSRKKYVKNKVGGASENDNGKNDNGKNDNGKNDNGKNGNGKNGNGKNDNGKNGNGKCLYYGDGLELCNGKDQLGCSEKHLCPNLLALQAILKEFKSKFMQLTGPGPAAAAAVAGTLAAVGAANTVLKAQEEEVKKTAQELSKINTEINIAAEKGAESAEKPSLLNE